jgi:hypothetical protein
MTDWDPASKQPLFKTAAAAVELLEPANGEPSRAPTTTGSRPVTASAAEPTAGGRPAGVHEELPETAGGAR